MLIFPFAELFRLFGVAVKEYSFGKTEFKAYFEKTRKPNLCNNEPAKLKAAFKNRRIRSPRRFDNYRLRLP